MKSILFVEDDLRLQKFYKSFLELTFEGIKIFQAFDGEEARPEAWGVEVGYNTEIIDRETLFSLGYLEFRDSLLKLYHPKLPAHGGPLEHFQVVELCF